MNHQVISTNSKIVKCLLDVSGSIVLVEAEITLHG